MDKVPEAHVLPATAMMRHFDMPQLEPNLAQTGIGDGFPKGVTPEMCRRCELEKGVCAERAPRAKLYRH
jgi:hypothetical protein